MESGGWPDRFEREYGCTEIEWRRWMPAATGGLPLREPSRHALEVACGAGTLKIAWTVLEPRVIALVRLPRLHVTFDFAGTVADERRDFMRRFDLHLQRGGG